MPAHAASLLRIDADSLADSRREISGGASLLLEFTTPSQPDGLPAGAREGNRESGNAAP